jgi:hypothetical protein
MKILKLLCQKITRRYRRMNEKTKLALESYLRNLLGVTLALVATTMANYGHASPIDFGAYEWLIVANGLWAAAIPTLIRWLNTKDPAFGRVAEAAAKEVSKKLSTAATKAKASSAKKTTTPAKKASTAKKTAKK